MQRTEKISLLESRKVPLGPAQVEHGVFTVASVAVFLFSSTAFLPFSLLWFLPIRFLCSGLVSFDVNLLGDLCNGMRSVLFGAITLCVFFSTASVFFGLGAFVMGRSALFVFLSFLSLSLSPSSLLSLR